MFDNISIEEVKKYWNDRPCNIRHSQKEIESKEYFDEVEKRKYFVEPHIPHFAQFKRWKGKKILEIGCGIGTDTINFARHGAQVTAVELSQESMKIARQRAKIFGLEDKINFHLGNAEELTSFVPIEEYDLVYSFGVIHHSPSPEKILKQIGNYLGQHSEVKVMVYHRFSWKVLWILFNYGKGQFWRLSDLIARYSEAQTGCPITYAYTKADLQKLFRQYGFDVKEIKVDHIFPYRIPDYKKYNYVKEWYFRWLPKRVFRWLEQHFGWHLCINAGVS